MRDAKQAAWVGVLFAATLAAAPAHAQFANFSGSWSVSGQIVAGTAMITAAPICTFQQNQAQVTGFCKGPNAAGPATGLVNGPTISWQWQVTPTTPAGISGLATFQGGLGPDGVIRGSWNHSRAGGATGPFTAQRM